MRLIDADALKEGIACHKQWTDQEYETDRKWAIGYNAGIERALFSITYARTIEAEPVRHGRWVREDDFAGAIDVPYLCSECSGKVLVSGIWTPKGYGYEYCPMCGAKMDLKGD